MPSIATYAGSRTLLGARYRSVSSVLYVSGSDECSIGAAASRSRVLPLGRSSASPAAPHSPFRALMAVDSARYPPWPAARAVVVAHDAHGCSRSDSPAALDGHIGVALRLHEGVVEGQIEPPRKSLVGRREGQSCSFGGQRVENPAGTTSDARRLGGSAVSTRGVSTVALESFCAAPSV